MKRFPDWQARLVIYLQTVVNEPFRPGEMDCALFVAGAIEAMTGTDLSAEFRGGYTTLKGGFKKLKKAGFKDLNALARAHLEEVPVAMAHVGDIALLKSDEGLAFGLVQGEYIFVRHPDGLAHVPLLDAVKAFRL
jgi:uncharacterized protein DUF6950